MMARILILDLNPQCIHPDLSIAYLVTPLRAAGLQVDVKTLCTDIQQLPPQKSKHTLSPVDLNLTTIQKYLEDTQPALILIPSYLHHYAAVQVLAKLTADLTLPVILGGACLSACRSEDLPLWLNLEGVTAVFVGEADWVIADLVDTLLSKQNLSAWPGICQRGVELETTTAPPLQELDLLPLPDFSDFAWPSYPRAFIPILTGRHTLLETGQTVYNSRPVQAVLEELKIQAERYQRKAFIFLDTSLNTNLAMWHGLIDTIQAVVPGCQWLATVHLDGKHELGLDLATFVAARAAGLRHVNISLDATQTLRQGKILNAALERNRALVAHAYQAGLSVRCVVHNQNLLTNLADLPNTNDFLLRKLVETEQAKQQVIRLEAEQTLHQPQSLHLNSANSPSKPLIKTINSSPPKPNVWQRFKKSLVSHKNLQTTEVNQSI
ncbi:MAG: B12-binding domain-containing radical SAM protein [Thiothrix sp.]|nr:MAG: B12-binding domain-containing radical SAM protein [Thiothrix sp.]